MTRRWRARPPTAIALANCGRGSRPLARSWTSGAPPTCPSSPRRRDISARITSTRTASCRTAGFWSCIRTFPDNWRARLDMQWPIYTGGRTKALEQAAVAEQSATGKDLESARADLRLETTRAFWALVTAIDSVSVFEESVKRIEAQLGDVRARFDAGFLPPNDVQTVQFQVASQRTLLIQARNQRDGSRAELARLMGAPVDATFEVDAVLADMNLAQPTSARPNPTATRRSPTRPRPRRSSSARPARRGRRITHRSGTRGYQAVDRASSAATTTPGQIRRFSRARTSGKTRGTSA